MSIVLEKKDITFVHIPKTAGTSIKKWLLDHNPYNDEQRYPRHSRPNTITTNHSFAVVRNPWDRLVSMYHYALAHVNHNNASVDLDPALINSGFADNLDTFSSFVENIYSIQLPQEYIFKLYDNQICWLSGVKTILRYENLTEDFGKIQEYFGSNDPLCCINSSDHKFYREYYTLRTKELVRQIFSQDINSLNYTF